MPKYVFVTGGVVFGIDSLPAERFYDKKEYAKYLKIKSGDFNAYCEQ